MKLDALTRGLDRHGWLILGGWVVLLGIGAVLALGLHGRLSGGGWQVEGSDSQMALEATTDGFVGRGPTTVQLVVSDERHRPGEPEFHDRQEVVWDAVRHDSRLHLTSAVGYAVAESESGRSSFVGSSGRTTTTTLALDLPDGDARRELPTVQHDLSQRFSERGLDVALVSAATVWGEINELSVQGLVRAELLALPLLLVIMLWLYRGWVPALMSLSVAVTAIVGTLALLRLLVRWVELSVFVQNAATMLGLGIAVDYSLFIIARFQEERSNGADPRLAVERSLRRAGHTVTASGLTVMVAMSTLFLVDLPVIRSLALGAVIVVAVGLVTNLLLLPSMLLRFGHRVPIVRRRGGAHRDSWTGRVMARPWPHLLLALAVLAALAAPAWQLSTFTPDSRILPVDAPVRQGIEAVQDDFGRGAASPFVVVVDASNSEVLADELPQLAELVEKWTADPSVANVRWLGTLVEPLGITTGTVLLPSTGATLPPDVARAVDHMVSADGDRLVLEVVPTDTASAQSTRALLERVRADAEAWSAQTDRDGLTLLVGGETAEGVDANAVIRSGMVPVAIAMFTVLYLLLLVTFRSLLLPLKALVLNVGSVAASYGVLVLVFQHGWGANVLGIAPSGYLTNFVPILLLTLLFSLSTDYEVFLLSRVREERLAGSDDVAAVAHGVRVTAPLVSGAAILMVAVFGAFTFAGVLPVQELGLGMAVAILLDATLVRLVLVPASMRLMGRWNWWLPGRPPVYQPESALLLRRRSHPHVRAVNTDQERPGLTWTRSTPSTQPPRPR